ncbi:hypothetical protein PENSUB_6393 [Penicillium subrubescens]|uniref:Uncharacterized protein n=1 Tax=Penicillium subrubescens TaxID=1316194 RepID=A0A1Q5U1N9_9EURO|nr:hypothetical protein PENSUB_6393 [Penicillium subrubescens]
MAPTSTMFSSLPSNVNERRMELFNLGLDAKLSFPGSEDPSGHSHQLEAIEYKLPTGVRDLAANEVG